MHESEDIISEKSLSLPARAVRKCSVSVPFRKIYPTQLSILSNIDK